MEQDEIRIEPEGALQEVISHFYCINTSSDFKPVVQHLSPNLQMMLVFNFSLPAKVSFADRGAEQEWIKKVAIIGPLRQMLNYEIQPDADIIICVFNPNGFYRLFQLHMGELVNKSVADPDELLGIKGFQDLWEILKSLPNRHERICMLEVYGHAFICEADRETDPLVKGTSYFNHPQIQPVKAISTDSGLSERTIQLRFKKYLGYSTKELLRFLRFKQVINSIQDLDTPIDWHEIVNNYGYHDQSHLIKDFRHYLGTTPQKFMKDIAGRQFCNTDKDQPAKI